MRMPRIPRLFKSKSRIDGRLAIGLGASGVYLAKVKLVGGMPCVLRCEYHETGALSAASLDKLRRAANLDEGGCITLLAPGEYQLSLVDAPNVPPEELKTAIRWKIKDNLLYPVDEAMIDVLQIPSSKFGGAERAQSVYAVSAASDIIRKRVEMFHQAGMELAVIDIPEMAQRNVAMPFEQEGRALALLAFDDHGGLLTFTAGGELYLARRIEVSVGQLREASDHLREQYRGRVELELQRSLDYFDRQFNHLPVNRVLVSVPDDTGLIEFLASVSDASVEKLDLSQAMDISAVAELEDSEFVARVLPTLGAALRQEGGRQ
ncbi:MAG: agglutinin biogenesis protein MshI [Gallionellales bacterium GWA2_59_43]|nr:MAG: agglutinin biogenesis protein MshI [Gallionellales bacterium GWA2_59_43]